MNIKPKSAQLVVTNATVVITRHTVIILSREGRRISIQAVPYPGTMTLTGADSEREAKLVVRELDREHACRRRHRSTIAQVLRKLADEV